MMIGFLNNKHQCLNQILLRYFDEEVPDNCNHCAVCLRQNETMTKPSQIKQQIILALQTHDSLSLRELLDLTGAEADQTTNWIRAMIEEKQLYLDEDGNISIYQS